MVNDGAPLKRKRGAGQHGKPTYNQAQKVIAKFGGEAKIAKVLAAYKLRSATPSDVEIAKATESARITAYRWGYAKPYGTDGLIPSHMLGALQQAARLDGVLLTAADWEPERISYSSAHQEFGTGHG